MRIPGQSLIAGFLLLLAVGSFGAPQDHWYAERDREFGFVGGMNLPMDILHAPDGKFFVVEGTGSSAVFDSNGELFAVKGLGTNPGGFCKWQTVCNLQPF